MENGVELSLDFHRHLGEDDFSANLIPFDHQQRLEQHEVNSTIEMVDQSVEAEVEESGGVSGDGGSLRGRGEPEQLEPHLGMEFDCLESARLYYFRYAERLGFRVRSSRFRTSRRDDSIIMRRFVCYKEGFYLQKEKKKKDAKERRKRGSIREGCRAMFEVVRKDQDRWVIAKLITEHTHGFSNAIRERKLKKKPTEPLFPVGLNSPLEYEEMSDDIRHIRIWGRGGEAFNLCEYFKKMQTKNPAFFYSIRVDENNNALTTVFWADSRARMAYSVFGDAVALDTTYKRSKHMMPFVSFTGVNHHLQPVIFGCAVIFDESVASFIWLFETFLTAMRRRHPISLTTELNEALGVAIGKVFPNTRHRYCKWQILRNCKEKLPDVSSTHAAWLNFKGELKRCIDETETVEDFESKWEAILVKYNLKENEWLLSLYKVRHQWVTVFQKDTFFAEMSTAQRSESMNKFFQRNFETKTTIPEFISKFDQAMAGQYEKEVQADFANLYTSPVLKTALQIELQAAETYTKTIFAIFQEEFVHSSSYSYSIDKCEDGMNYKYLVVFNGTELHQAYTVSFNYPEKRANCSCRKFEFSGILCRHVLRVFSGLHVRKLPDDYFLRRWTKAAKTAAVLYESHADLTSYCEKALLLRYNDLCLDVFNCAAEGATSSVIYNVAKDALHKAFAEVAAAKKALYSMQSGR